MLRRNYYDCILFMVVLLLSSCAFNRQFYQPDTNKVILVGSGGEEIYLTSAHDNKIHCLFYAKENPIATLFISHGNAGNLSSWAGLAKQLNDNGYQTFIYDYEGFGNSEGRPTHAHAKRDAQVALNYLLNRKEVKGTKIIAMGFSLGANLSTYIASKNNNNIDALCIEGGFTSQRKISRSLVPWIIKPLAFLLVRNAINGERCIYKFIGPVLIVHSTQDEVIPYKNGEQLFRAANEPKELWTITGRHIGGLDLFEKSYLIHLQQLVDKIAE